MPQSTLFWLMFVLTIFLGGFGFYRTDVNGRWVIGPWFMILVLVGLLGWAVFGKILQDSGGQRSGHAVGIVRRASS